MYKYIYIYIELEAELVIHCYIKVIFNLVELTCKILREFSMQEAS